MMAGCNTLNRFLGLDTVEVVLVNQGSFPVEVDLYISDVKDIPESLLVTLGEKLEFTLAPGQTQRFSRSCDDLKAMIIHDADLRVAGSIGPEAETNVLRTDGDFDCGDQIVFAFVHSPIITDFHITTQVLPRSLFAPSP